MLIQEICKCFVLYPRATADILDVCNIKYQSLRAKDLSLAVENSGKNLKMLNRLVRLSFLINQKGDVSMKNHNRNISYRDVMRSGKPFVKEHNEIMKEATLISRDMMNQKFFSKMLGENVTTYCNLDGQGDVDEPKETINSQLKTEESKTNPIIYIGIALVVVGAIFYFVKKNKAQ